MGNQEIENTGINSFLDKMILKIGVMTSWLNIALIIAIISQVILRYCFDKGIVILEELQWHFYGIMVMMSISYAVTTDEHIRLDILYTKFSPKKKAVVDIIGIIFLLLPMIVVIFDNSLGFVYDSWKVNERSDAPMGLCCRWAFKSFMSLGIALVGIAAISKIFTNAKIIIRTTKACKRSEKSIMSDQSKSSRDNMEL